VTEVFDFSQPMDGSELARLRQASYSSGFFYARHPLFDEPRSAAALELARNFFALPPAQKQSLDIERSLHYRGYSVMQNSRDWREQIHFGRETPETRHPLEGPNLWPADPDWRSAVLSLLADFEAAGRTILDALAACLNIPADDLLAGDEQPYLLLKMIHYLVPPDATPRSGVAPHVDFSWITLLLQDATGGLSVCTPQGVWHDVEPLAGTLVVNLGEILQFATRGYFLATPHRVISRTGSRLSLPFFLNPGLRRDLAPRESPFTREEWPGPEPVHVHRVMPVRGGEPFCFGDAEWHRKGEGVWCRQCRAGS
jgi:isopenicillin N synthase-like dioxygenase